MRRRILVTGSNGQLGKSLQKTVSQKPNIIDYTFTSRDSLDISNPTALELFFSKNSFDYCINCAAYTSVDKAEEEPEKAFLINSEAVKSLTKVCKKNGTVLIHISTDFVFDGIKREPYLETDLTNPLNVYGSSKLRGEENIRKSLKKFYIIRTSWVYSEFGNNFVKTILRLANEREEISVVKDQIGCPTYAGDLANFIIEILYADNDKFGTYHYCNQGALSWYNFAKYIVDYKRLDCSVIPILSKDFKALATRPKYSVLNSSKTFETFNELKSKDVFESLNTCLINL